MTWLCLLAAGILFAQDVPQFPAPPREAAEAPVEFVCPMDPDVRSKAPGKCPRCGMNLVAGIPEQMEYPVNLQVTPKAPRPGQNVTLAFQILDPKTNQRVTDFEIVHEKLFHMFIVSQDLQFFLHEHPRKDADSIFRYTAQLPKPGMYRVLSDFYPRGGIPQLIARTLIVPGAPVTPGTKLTPDVSPQKSDNLTVALRMEPQQPIAGMKTLLFFRLDPGDHIEQYLAAWGHMMAASSDLVDMIHTHPFLADGGPNIQFNVIFPRPGVYRLWVQFQRLGVVNTVAFNVPVTDLK